MIAPLVNDVACENAKTTFNQFLFKKFGLECHKDYDRVVYLEKLMYIDYVQSLINSRK